MADRLKELPKKMLEAWNKFTSKQKTIMISVFSVVVFSFALLIILSGRVKYEDLTITETTSEASDVIELLKKEGIKYKLGSDRLTVSVDLKRYSDAVLLLASNDMPSTGITLDELLNNSLSTTNSDRTLKINLYMQNQLKKYITTMVGVKDADVYYIPVESSNTIFAPAQETNASVLLEVTKDFDVKTAETIATMVASVIGNSSSEKIKVADQYGNLLYGGEQDLYSGSASGNADYAERLRNTFINNLYMLLIKSGYDDVEIAPYLVIDNKKIEEMFKEYLPADGQEQGVYKRSYTYNSENAAGTGGGVPGTTANDETDYMLEDSSSTTGNVEIEEFDYLPNERVTNTQYEVGAVDAAKSSVSIVLRKVTTYEEEDLKRQGLLDDIDFEAYVLENQEETILEVDPELIRMVSLATGISENNIQISAKAQPLFIPIMDTNKSLTDYLQYIIALLIIVFIAIVVFKSFGPAEVTEMEPELSVEQLLATTKENQSLEEIDFSEVSEVRKMIEKLVDEKPDAVAQLLRNWLNEEWD